MAEENNRTETVHSIGFLVFLYQWRWHLGLITLGAVVLSAFFSSPWFIPPKYKSTVIMYPVSTSSISKALLGENISQKNDIMEFGEEEQAEQMLQILSSNKIRDRVIEKFNLFEHYGISSDAKYRYTRLIRTYENNITFRRTEYMAVKVTVLDKDPQIAADLANEIANLLDSTKSAMQKERAIMAYQIMETEYNSKKLEIELMEDSLTKLREMGVHDYETQAEMINQQLAIELAAGNKAGIRALEEKLAILAKYGGPYVSIRDALEHEKKQFSEIKAKLDEAKIDAKEVLPQKFVVNYAFKAERKSYPVRWIIVTVTAFSAFLIAVLACMVYSAYVTLGKKKIETKQNTVISQRI